MFADKLACFRSSPERFTIWKSFQNPWLNIIGGKKWFILTASGVLSKAFLRSQDHLCAVLPSQLDDWNGIYRSLCRQGPGKLQIAQSTEINILFYHSQDWTLVAFQGIATDKGLWKRPWKVLLIFFQSGCNICCLMLWKNQEVSNKIAF